ncbi:MAG: DUF3267 domain-containing protein [Ignavibacteriales bacterium]|nr:MAG: DUF3267 domain-containing protein [Ignavibacteriales bacterium]
MLTEPSPNQNKKDLSVSMLAANLYSIPIVLLVSAFTVTPFLLIWGMKPFRTGFNEFSNLFVFIPAVLIGVVLHEIIHAVSWKYLGRKSWDTIKIGFQWETITPYAHCSEPVNVKVYRAGTIAPVIILGFIPVLIATISGNGWLMTFGFLFTVAAGGDFLILWLIRKVNSDYLIEDHPERAGCYVLEKISGDNSEIIDKINQ